MLRIVFRRFTGVVFLALGTAVVVAMVNSGIQTAKFLSRATQIEAIVVRIEKYSGKGGTRNHPVYVYRDTSGHRWEGSLTDWNNRLVPGEKISVYYDPIEPMVSADDASWWSWLGIVFWGFWGSAFALFGWGMLWTKKHAPDAPTC